MKKLFLGALALATSISCFSFTNNSNKKGGKLFEEIRNANGINPNAYYQTYEEKESNDTNLTANVIPYRFDGSYNAERITGILEGMDSNDWFRVTFDYTTNRHFYLEANNGLNYCIYAYADYNNPRLLYSSAASGKETTMTLVPGTYYFRMNSLISGNQQYKFYYIEQSTHYDNFRITPTAKYKYAGAIWENDIMPKNQTRSYSITSTEEESKIIRARKTNKKWVGPEDQYPVQEVEYEAGYVDPLFMTVDNQQTSFKYLDSIVYIWDKNVLQTLYKGLTDLIQSNIDEWDRIKQEQIDEMKAGIQEEGLVEVGKFVFNLWLDIHTFGASKGAKFAAKIISKSIEEYDLIKSFVKMICPEKYVKEPNMPDLRFTTMLAKLQQACYDAMHTDDFILKIPRYSQIVRSVENYSRDPSIGEYYDYEMIYWKWCTTPFEFCTDGDFYIYNSDYISSARYDGMFGTYHLGQIRPFSREHGPVLESISLSGNYKTSIKKGLPFNHDGLVVTAHYEGGQTKQVTDFTVSTPDTAFETGDKTVTVTYSENGIEVSTTYTVNVFEGAPELQSITLSGSYPTWFHQGDPFSIGGLVVTAHYDVGPSREITNYTLNHEVGSPMIYQGNNTILVKYNENGVYELAYYTVWVEVDYPVIQSISLEGDYKTEFEQGEPFSYEGLIVVAHYDKGEPRVVTNYRVAPPMVMHYSYNYHVVSVYYIENNRQVIADYKIYVHRVLSGLEVSGNYPTSFDSGIGFNTSGMVVKAVYKDGSKKTLSSGSYTVDSSEVRMLKTGTYNVYVSYTERDVTCTFTYQVSVTYKPIINPKPWKPWIDLINGGGIIITDPGFGGGIGGGSGNF